MFSYDISVSGKTDFSYSSVAFIGVFPIPINCFRQGLLTDNQQNNNFTLAFSLTKTNMLASHFNECNTIKQYSTEKLDISTIECQEFNAINIISIIFARLI